MADENQNLAGNQQGQISQNSQTGDENQGWDNFDFAFGEDETLGEELNSGTDNHEMVNENAEDGVENMKDDSEVAIDSSKMSGKDNVFMAEDINQEETLSEKEVSKNEDTGKNSLIEGVMGDLMKEAMKEAVKNMVKQSMKESVEEAVKETVEESMEEAVKQRAVVVKSEVGEIKQESSDMNKVVEPVIDGIQEEKPNEDLKISIDGIQEEKPDEDLKISIDGIQEEKPDEDLEIVIDDVQEEKPDEDLEIVIDDIQDKKVEETEELEIPVIEEKVEETAEPEIPVIEEKVEETAEPEIPVIEEKVEETAEPEIPVIEEKVEETAEPEIPVIEEKVEETEELEIPVIEEKVEETAEPEIPVIEEKVEETAEPEIPVIEEKVEETAEPEIPVIEEKVEETEELEIPVIEEKVEETAEPEIPVIEEKVEETAEPEIPVIEEKVEETAEPEIPVIEEKVEETAEPEIPVMEEKIEEAEDLMTEDEGVEGQVDNSKIHKNLSFALDGVENEVYDENVPLNGGEGEMVQNQETIVSEANFNDNIPEESVIIDDQNANVASVFDGSVLVGHENLGKNDGDAFNLDFGVEENSKSLDLQENSIDSINTGEMGGDMHLDISTGAEGETQTSMSEIQVENQENVVEQQGESGVVLDEVTGQGVNGSEAQGEQVNIMEVQGTEVLSQETAQINDMANMPYLNTQIENGVLNENLVSQNSNDAGETVQSTLSLDQILDSELLTVSQSVNGQGNNSVIAKKSKNLTVTLVGCGILALVAIVVVLAFPFMNVERNLGDVVTDNYDVQLTGEYHGTFDYDSDLFVDSGVVDLLSGINVEESDGNWSDVSGYSDQMDENSQKDFPEFPDPIDDYEPNLYDNVDISNPSVYVNGEIYTEEEKVQEPIITVEEVKNTISSFKSQAEIYYSLGQESLDKNLIKYASQMLYLCESYETKISNLYEVSDVDFAEFRSQIQGIVSKIASYNGEGQDATIYTVVSDDADSSYFEGKDEIMEYLYSK